jgi:antitoxin (DNA-binding transcriptional repressor) of toxin-antitoxin stability system
MRAVNVAELKDHLSQYLAYVRNGEEIIVRDRKLPVARLVAFVPNDASQEELMLIAAGKMRPAQVSMDIDELLRIPTGRVKGNTGIEALLRDREESR